jgi:hypothetical protein
MLLNVRRNQSLHDARISTVLSQDPVLPVMGRKHMCIW